MKKLYFVLFAILTALSMNAQSCPDNNHPHMIDLGLPSGTKWACCNVGTSTPEGYGGYYAWGETEEKEVYDWESYIYCDGTEETCHDIGADIAGTDYDVAHVKWGDPWVMPTKDQFWELLTRTTFSWVKQNGVDGAKFTGYNGQSIFMPAAGIKWFGDLDNANVNGEYLASTLAINTEPSNVCGLGFNFGGRFTQEGLRCIGRSVRPVGSVTNSISLLESSADKVSQPVYNLYGIKVADHAADLKSLPAGVYIVNGSKVVMK